MKQPLLLAAVLVFASFGAQATYCSNGAKDWPKCTPPATPSSTPSVDVTSTLTSNVQATIESQTDVRATSTSGAVSGSSSNATGGQSQSSAQGGKASASGGAGGGGGSINSSNGDFWVFPAPVFTPPLPKIDGCPQANISQDNFGFGWNFVSKAGASVNTDNCTAIILYNTYVETCQYESAQRLLRRLEQRVLPGDDIAAPGAEYINLGRRECDILRTPLPIAAPVRLPADTALPPPPVCPVGAVAGPQRPTKPTAKPGKRTRKIARVCK